MQKLVTLNNFVMPARGLPAAYRLTTSYSTPTSTDIDFSVVEIDGTTFNPTGVFIDNTLSSNICRVYLSDVQYAVQCPAGRVMTIPFPSVDGMVATVISAQTTLVFVDYPVFPWLSNAI